MFRKVFSSLLTSALFCMSILSRYFVLSRRKSMFMCRADFICYEGNGHYQSNLLVSLMLFLLASLFR